MTSDFDLLIWIELEVWYEISIIFKPVISLQAKFVKLVIENNTKQTHMKQVDTIKLIFRQRKRIFKGFLLPRIKAEADLGLLQHPRWSALW